jgi:hypothetical protein
MKQTSLILAKECMSMLISIAFLICLVVMTVGIWFIRGDIHNLLDSDQMSLPNADPGPPIQAICFAAGDVQLANGLSIPIQDLREGDIVLTASKKQATIHKVFSSRIAESRKFCRINGAILTHRHPIYHNGIWVHPCDVSPSFDDTLVTYNFELYPRGETPEDHTIIVNDITCSTLGCGPENLRERFPLADSKWGSGYWQNNTTATEPWGSSVLQKASSVLSVSA